MKPLARRTVATVVCAAILMAQWPAAAWAGGKAALEAETGDPNINAAAAMKMFRDLGVYKGDDDPLKSYLGNDGKLTPLGEVMYQSLLSRYNPAEEVESMKPMLTRMRQVGPYNEARANSAARAVKMLEDRFSQLDQAPAGSLEESVRIGAKREAMMNGASIADPPAQGAYAQVRVKDGVQFRDKDGLAFQMFVNAETKTQVTTYSRDVQKNQRLMNQNRPPQVPFIPETGRYNYEMLQYTYWRLKNQESDYVNAARVDRMIAMAELLGKNYPSDLWFNDKTLEPDLIRQAKAKTYKGNDGTVYSVYDLVDRKFRQREAYLQGVRRAIDHLEMDMNKFKDAHTITDSQIATMSLDEKGSLRWLSLTVVETQMFQVKNMAERVDPSSPDSQAIMKVIDESDLSDDQKTAYKEQGRRMKARLDELRRVLAMTRDTLSASDYGASLDAVQNMLASTQKELVDLSTDYSIYLETPSMAFLAKGQKLQKHSWYNAPGHLYNGISTVVRGAYKMTPWGAEYKGNMDAIEGDHYQSWQNGKPRTDASGKPVMIDMTAAYTEIAGLVASGRRQDWVEARQRIIAMKHGETEYTTGPPSDAARIASTLKSGHSAIGSVAETNKSLDAASTFLTWTISIALLAPVARASLNWVGKLSTTGVNIMKWAAPVEEAGIAKSVGLFAVRSAGRVVFAAGEIARHSAARLESLEPSVARVKSVAGENAIAQYLVASGARAGSVAIRQGGFTILSGGISAGFTLGSHFWDMATNRIGGVNVAGYQLIEPGHSMFSDDGAGAWKAVTAGFKGGVWWANESFHPGLGYIGLPSTVFGGIKYVSPAMETIGQKGVVGTFSSAINYARLGGAGVEAAAARGELSFLERLSVSPNVLSKSAAFTLSMADNVAKYALFSQAAGYLGEKYSWYVAPYAPLIAQNGEAVAPEEDIERRIKKANATGKAWLESPAWLLIPTHGAHSARDAGPYMMTREGMKQYDAEGRTSEYANAPENTPLKLRSVKPPLSQRLFEARIFGEKPATEWIVTKQAKEMGQFKEINRLAKENGVVNPVELMAVRELGSGDMFRTLHVTEEVQKTAYDVATEGLVDQPARSLKALRVTPGENVEGWGRITPDIQIDIAKALYRAETNLGKKLTPELSARVREVLKDHLTANLPIGAAGKTLRAAVVDLPLESPKLDLVQKEHINRVLSWETSPAKPGPDGKPVKQSYLDLTLELRADAEARLQKGELTAKEARALTSLYDYIITGDKRFNAFNRVEIVKARADVVFDALALEYRNRGEMLDKINEYRTKVHDWAEGRDGQIAEGKGKVPEGMGLEDVVKVMAKNLEGLQKAPGKLGPSELAALKKAIDSVQASPWVVRDAKGGAIPGWRDKQYVRLMQSFLGEGSHADFVSTTTKDLFKSMRSDAKLSPKMLKEIASIESDVNAWVKSREGKVGEETGMVSLIDKLEQGLPKATEGLSGSESAALEDLVTTISKLDREGLHKGILSSGRQGHDVQLFVKAPTSLGKTLLAYEGLLPYLEAEAAASKRKVMFLTFNTKLQAQAEFDFLAFNKLGSEVKFETYEGLKTMIAEGKTKGVNIVEQYLMLQDEMDAAGQQPALTIGMVSGRVSRLNGQTTAINESNAGLNWAMDRLNTIRVEAAEVQARRIQSLVSGLSEANMPAERVGEFKVAADDVVQAVNRLKRAEGAVEVSLAEKSIETGMAKLRQLASAMPAGEAEAATTMLAALGRMKEALALRPAANPAERARIADEMESAFVNQRRLMDLTNTAEGLSRLPAEARKARLALETKIENLRKSLAEAEKAGSPRAALIREQIEYARLDKTLVERFDGVDSSARLISLDEQIAAIRFGEAPANRLTINPKLERLMRESVRLEVENTPESAARRKAVDARLEQSLKSMGPVDATALKAYRAETARLMTFEGKIKETEAGIKGAKKNGQSVATLETRLVELEAGRQTSKAEVRRLETQLGAVKSTPRLDALVKEAQALEADMTPERRAVHQEYRETLDKIHDLNVRIGQSDAAGRPALESERATARGRLRSIELDLSASRAQGDLGGMLRRIDVLASETGKDARAEEKALRREARAEIMRRFDQAGDEILALTKEGKPGWDAKVSRLLETRRALQEAYAGDESAMYTAYRQMKEDARPIGENPRLTRKPYEIPGGDGMDPASVAKRAEWLIDRADKVEPKQKGGEMGEVQSKLMLARERLKSLSDKPESSEYFEAFNDLRKLEGKLIDIDSYHEAGEALKAIDGVSLGTLALKYLWSKMPGAEPLDPNAVGMTRRNAARMLKSLFEDPMMPAHQRDALMWSYLNSLLFPKGVGHFERGSSYVRNEIVNMVQGFNEGAAGVRVDNKTGKFNVVHNGQWFESMDNASRRWWELEYGTDLTLPYTHNAMSTIKDVTTNKKSYFISLSGTSGAKFEAHLRANDISMVGEGSAVPKNVLLDVVSTPEQRLQRVADALGKLRTATLDQVVLRGSDAIPAEIKADVMKYLGDRGLSLKDPQVLQISDVPGEAAQKWLRSIRETQKNTGLVVLSVSDTRALRAVESYLKKNGVNQDEIAKVFADTEYLRLNAPEANVLKQMNIEGLNTGKVKVLILDTRVGGRGLDLNFKGERNSLAADAFRGYSKFEMLVLGPEEMSQVHMIQAMGRIDVGRTLSQAPRQFTLLMDIDSAAPEAVFRRMFETDPFFTTDLRRDPTFQEYVRKHGGVMDWHASNDFLHERMFDGSGEGALMYQRYEKALRKALGARNLEVEENLLRQSNVLTDAPTTQGKNPALERIR